MTPEFIECVGRRTLAEFERYGRDPVRFMVLNGTHQFYFYIERVSNGLLDEGPWWNDALSYRCIELVNEALSDHLQNRVGLRDAVRKAMRREPM